MACKEVTRGMIDQLRQLAGRRFAGVWAGDLIDKCSTRELVRMGLAENTGGSPSALSTVYISAEGRSLLADLDEVERLERGV